MIKNDNKKHDATDHFIISVTKVNVIIYVYKLLITALLTVLYVLTIVYYLKITIKII